MADALLYLTERDVVSVLDMRRAIDALHGMLVAQGRDEARNLPKALATWGDGSSMHALGSVQTGEGGYAGFKTWVHTKAGGGSVFSLFDARTGFLRAVIEARALGMLRTAAISGVATRAPGAAGRQPRRADRHRTAGRDAAGGAGRGARAAAGARVQPHGGKAPRLRGGGLGPLCLRDRGIPTLAHALADAEIVTLITRAVEPFVDARPSWPTAAI